MEIIPPLLNKTELHDRTLWFDGDSSYPADNVTRAIVRDGVTFVNEMTRDIQMYNLYVLPEDQIRVKTENRELKFDWNIPEEFKNLNVDEYLKERLLEQYDANPEWRDLDVEKRALRVHREMKLFKKHALIDVLKVLIYIINTLHNEKVVWGVGRGSSVSSYVLYLLGVHDVDSVEYDLDIADFLH